MKKLLFMLLALPLLVMTACHNDDDDYPDVKIGLDYSGATSVEGTLYAVQGDTLTIDSVFVNPVNPNSRAIIGDVTYIFDGRMLGIATASPFTVGIQTATIPEGKHDLNLRMSVFENDRTPAIFSLNVPVTIVKEASQIPSGTPKAGGTYSDTGRRVDK